MTSNGKIDIYAEDSISIHTKADFNVTADKNINLTAKGDINLKATGNANMTAAGNSNIKSSHHFETAGRIDMNGPAATAAIPAPRIPDKEPWADHENLHGKTGYSTATDTFAQIKPAKE